MLKSSLLNYHTSIRNTIKSSPAVVSVLCAIILPVIICLLLLLFEDQIVYVIMDWYPPSERQGELFYHDLVSLARTEILWLGAFVLLALVFNLYTGRASLSSFFNVKSRTKAVYYMMLITSVFFLSTIFIGNKVLEDFANSSDEYAYLFQAEMFSNGKRWARAHDLPDFFYLNNVTQHDGILVSRFPPGWPLILSGAFEIGLNPALVNPILGLVTLVLFYFFAEKYYGHKVAVWSLFGLAFTGFYIYNSASYFSHVSCLFFTLLFVFSVYLYREKNNFLFGLLAGFCLAFVLLIRYYTALLIFIPFFVYLLTEYKWKVVPLFFWMAVGSVPCVAYLLWYNYSITGNPFSPVTVWAYPDEQLGFVRGHTFLRGLEHFVRWIIMFIYWTSPGILILYMIFLWRKIKTPAERFARPEDYAMVTLIIGYFFYYQIGGNQYGPRFFFEALPFVIVFVVNRVFEAREKWATALLIVSMLYPVARLPFISYREARIVDQRQDVYDLVEEQKISNAVVIVASPTSPLRPMPAEDLTRNDSKFMNDVIYVLELPRINPQLEDYYRDRSFYKYVRDLDDPQGELIRIR
jgi:hypothetical protein